MQSLDGIAGEVDLSDLARQGLCAEPGTTALPSKRLNSERLPQSNGVAPANYPSALAELPEPE